MVRNRAVNLLRALAAWIIYVSASTSAARAEDLGIRLVLGLTDTTQNTWDGSAESSGARISSIEPWRFEAADRIDGSSWRCSTRSIRLFGPSPAPRPVVAN